MPRSERRLRSAAELGRRIRARRDELGLSQMALADRIGMHFTFVSSIERGERNISLESLLRLAVGLELDPGELVSGLKPAKQPRAGRS